MEITTFEEEQISDIVSFWNETFSDRRNFIQMTPALLEERILQVDTAQESFDPESLLLAQEGAEVLGMMHVGTYPEPICQLMYGEEWDGGVMGYVGMLAVHPDYRGDGIGSDLWEAGIERVSHATMIDLDGQCLNPFYGNSLGPFQPLWGTTEGVSIGTDQDRAFAFFERRGFEPTYEGVSLEVETAKVSADASTEGGSRRINGLLEEYPALGESPDERLPYPNAENYICVQLVLDNLTAGILSMYPFTELDEEKWGIYEFRVAEEYHGEGHRRALLHRGIQEVRERGGDVLETLLLRELSEDELPMHRELGFDEVATWHIY
jgi:GNAT superfamily N-acetyltransferase